jgi:mono/diheme cytochrome c family protein
MVRLFPTDRIEADAASACRYICTEYPGRSTAVAEEAVTAMTVFQRMTYLCITGVLAGLPGVSTTASSADFDRGKALYEEHCQHCHEDWEHSREESAGVASLDGLRARVAAWSMHSGLGWSAEEIDEVTSYLNQRFYRLTK